MKQLSILIKPASSLCNMNCKYCFYQALSTQRICHSFGFMNDETMTKMVDTIFSYLHNDDQLTLIFQGGEPTLAPLDYYHKLISYIKKKNTKLSIRYVLQTNGFVFDEAWYLFLKDNNFLVGLSLDGPQEIHDYYRVDKKGFKTFEKVSATKSMLEKYSIPFNLMCVLTNKSSFQAKEIFTFFLKEKIEFIQFIPCIGEVNALNKDMILESNRFYQFYYDLFQLWIVELQKGVYISIKFFEDIINLFVMGSVTSCGINGACQLQIVIEADGSVYPCDFYASDEYRLGMIGDIAFNELKQSSQFEKFINKEKGLSSYCATCEFNGYCRGGCTRVREHIYVDLEHSFCGYQQFLKFFIPQMPKILDLYGRGKQ